MLDARGILEGLGIEAGMHVAEFGSSRTGHFSLAASALVGESGEMYAVDLSPEVLEMLHGRCRLEGCTNVTPVWGDYEREGGVGIPEGSLDVVLLTHTLPQVRKPEALAYELARLTKPDGRIVVIDWEPEADHPLCPNADSCLLPQKAEALLRRHGFQHESWFDPAPTHWGGIWRRT